MSVKLETACVSTWLGKHLPSPSLSRRDTESSKYPVCCSPQSQVCQSQSERILWTSVYITENTTVKTGISQKMFLRKILQWTSQSVCSGLLFVVEVHGFNLQKPRQSLIDDDRHSGEEADKEMTWMMQNVTNNNVVFNIANWYLQDTKMAFLPPSKRKKIIA